ncbi:MAG: L-seryl-tRNA(Sec) selenium transferase, partial [Limnochordales bacterium]
MTAGTSPGVGPDRTEPGGGPDAAAALRRLPAVDQLLKAPAVAAAAQRLPRPLVVDAVRAAVAEARQRILAGAPPPDGPALAQRAAAHVHALRRRLLTPVINATGVVLHTNLGRAPLSRASIAAMEAVAAGYSNLEYEIETGRRGSRHVHGEALLTRLTGAEAAMVVNNNAAAVLLVLSALAHGREVIISRGEMIEIGGAFRIPEVMAQSGCLLREVGTTNRTHRRDYEQAIGPQTAAILKVHPSNYRVVGFTASVSTRELAALARRHGLLLIEDLGSGVLLPTEGYGLAHEPTVQETVAAGADLVTFSGDKLLGGPQAGIIVGRRDLVERCRRHPLARAVRVDKLTLAALQATLQHYLDGTVEEIPVYRMLAR